MKNTEDNISGQTFVTELQNNVSFPEGARAKDLFTIVTYFALCLLVFLQLFMAVALDIFM